MWKKYGGRTWKATQGSETIKTIRAVVAVVNKGAVVNNESKYGYRSIYHLRGKFEDWKETAGQVKTCKRFRINN